MFDKSKGKIPSLEKLSSEEDRTHYAASSKCVCVCLSERECDSNPESSTLEADALTTRPSKREFAVRHGYLVLGQM